MYMALQGHQQRQGLGTLRAKGSSSERVNFSCGTKQIGIMQLMPINLVNMNIDIYAIPVHSPIYIKGGKATTCEPHAARHQIPCGSQDCLEICT